MDLSNDVQLARLLSPETRRLRTYELDAALDVALVQRLNDLAFLFGTQIVSVCAGHRDGCRRAFDFALERSFAEVRFAIFFGTLDRLAAQQARICIELLAGVCAGPETVVESSHVTDVGQGSRTPRRRRLGRSLVAVRHARPTAEAPALAQHWWELLVARLEGTS